MIGDAASWVGIVGGVLGVVGVITGGLVILKSKIASATIDLLNENVDAQRQRIEILERENEQLRARVEVLEHTKDELFAQVKSLPAFTAMVTSMMEIQETLTTHTQLMAKIVGDR